MRFVKSTHICCNASPGQVRPALLEYISRLPDGDLSSSSFSPKSIVFEKFGSCSVKGKSIFVLLFSDFFLSRLFHSAMHTSNAIERQRPGKKTLEAFSPAPLDGGHCAGVSGCDIPVHRWPDKASRLRIKGGRARVTKEPSKGKYTIHARAHRPSASHPFRHVPSPLSSCP